MSGSIHIVCPRCQSINRVPANKLAEKPNCGRCQHPLFTGEPIELTTATVEDITDLTRVEQALNAMRRLREELASHVPGMLYQYRLRPDGSSHFPYASARIQEIYGVAPEDVVEDATPAFAALHPEDRDRVHETIQASGQSLALWHDEYRVQFPDGRVIWVEGEASPEAMPDGSILWHGHGVGDKLLSVLSRRMTQVLREDDTLARLGGDEFVAILLDLPDTSVSVPILERLIEVAAQPVPIGDALCEVSASIGVSYYPQGEDIDADQLLRQADQAMYRAKQAGKNRYHVFDTEKDRTLRTRHEGFDSIESALAATGLHQASTGYVVTTSRRPAARPEAA